MNRDTKIIVGKVGVGKTTELIERSAESGIYILVANRKRAEMLVKQAEDMKLYIPFPVTLQEWLSSSTRFHGSSIRRDGLLIDDIDDVIKELFLPIEIKAVTLRTPQSVTELGRNGRNRSETKRKYYRKCGVCGERHEQSEMIRTDNSPNGWICFDCHKAKHPEYDIDEW